MAESYGWFSQQQADLFGSCQYLTPEGKEVTVSQVSSSPEDSHSKWEDILFVGRVTTFVSKSSGSESWVDDLWQQEEEEDE